MSSWFLSRISLAKSLVCISASPFIVDVWLVEAHVRLFNNLWRAKSPPTLDWGPLDEANRDLDEMAIKNSGWIYKPAKSLTQH